VQPDDKHFLELVYHLDFVALLCLLQTGDCLAQLRPHHLPFVTLFHLSAPVKESNNAKFSQHLCVAVPVGWGNNLLKKGIRLELLQFFVASSIASRSE
jgi:hypothetical protein